MNYLLIIIALILALLSFQNYDLQSFKFWVLASLTVLFAIISAKIQWDTNKKEKYESSSGVVVSKKVSKPLYLGYGTYKGEILDGVLDLSTYDKEFFSDVKFKVWVEDDKVLLNTDIRNEDGALIARIVRNEWSISKNLSFEKNFDDHALEVLDNNGDIVLQIDLINKNTIILRGIFYDSNSNAIIITDVGGAPFIAVIDVKDKREFLKTLKPIFKFPSSLHMGERINKL